jgi:hypothetical protein
VDIPQKLWKTLWEKALKPLLVPAYPAHYSVLPKKCADQRGGKESLRRDRQVITL